MGVVEDSGGTIEIKCTSVFRNGKIVVENFESVAIAPRTVIIKVSENTIIMIKDPAGVVVYPCRLEDLKDFEEE